MPIKDAILLNERDYFMLVAAGDEVAFSVIFYHYTSRIHPMIKKITRSEEVTEEIIQDVFVSLWKNREKLGEIDNYAAYIFTTATNKTFNYLKLKARIDKYLNAVRIEKDFTNNTLETIELHETRELVIQLIKQLSPQKKLIYNLTREEGLTHEQIAQKLNISKNTVKNHLVDTLKFLRENLLKSETVFLFLINIFIRIRS